MITKHKLQFEESICRECCSRKDVLFCRDTEEFICRKCLIEACAEIEKENEALIIEEHGINIKNTDSYKLMFDESCKEDLEDYLK